MIKQIIAILFKKTNALVDRSAAIHGQNWITELDLNARSLTRDKKSILLAASLELRLPDFSWKTALEKPWANELMCRTALDQFWVVGPRWSRHAKSLLAIRNEIAFGLENAATMMDDPDQADNAEHIAESIVKLVDFTIAADSDDILDVFLANCLDDLTERYDILTDRDVRGDEAVVDFFESPLFEKEQRRWEAWVAALKEAVVDENSCTEWRTRALGAADEIRASFG